jgi:hypothetical protein
MAFVVSFLDRESANMATGHDENQLQMISLLSHRLSAVEKEVAVLRQSLQSTSGNDQPWYLKHAGRFKDDPEFEEVVRLGREIREGDRPD